jgi:hypothetical protein
MTKQIRSTTKVMSLGGLSVLLRQVPFFTSENMRHLILIVCLAGGGGCASFKPEPVASVPFRERALPGGDDRYHIEVAVPDTKEAARLFDRHLHKKDIQPVWLRIENRGPTPAYFLPRAIDPEYYSALEVAPGAQPGDERPLLHQCHARRNPRGRRAPRIRVHPL